MTVSDSAAASTRSMYQFAGRIANRTPTLNLRQGEIGSCGLLPCRTDRLRGGPEKPLTQVAFSPT